MQYFLGLEGGCDGGGGEMKGHFSLIFHDNIVFQRFYRPKYFELNFIISTIVKKTFLLGRLFTTGIKGDRYHISPKKNDLKLFSFRLQIKNAHF